MKINHHFTLILLSFLTASARSEDYYGDYGTDESESELFVWSDREQSANLTIYVKSITNFRI
jgi:hypothetical protein